MIIIKNNTTVTRVSISAFLSVIYFKLGRRIFSIKRALGARSVPDAVDMIADKSAPKNIICTKSGVLSRISAGRIRCVSPTDQINSGAIIKAAYPSIIGKNAIII